MPKDQPGYWLCGAFVNGVLCLILAHYWGRAFLVVGAALVAFNCLRAFLVFRRRLIDQIVLKELEK